MNGRKPMEPVSGAVWRLASVGTELAAAVLGGCALGWWVDRAFQTGPWGLVIGATMGIVGGLYDLVRKAVHESLGVAGRQEQDSAPSRREDQPPSEGDRP